MSPTVAAKWSKGSGGPSGDEAQNLVPTSYGIRSDAVREGIARTPSADAKGRVRLRDPGLGIYDQLSPTLDTVSPHIVAHPELAGTLGAQGYRSHTELDGHGAHIVEPLPFYTTQITSPANRSQPQPGDPCHPLARGAHAPAVIGFHHNAQACQLPTDARDTSISDSLTTSQNAAGASIATQVIGFPSNLGSQGGDVFDGVSPTMRIGTQSEKGGGNPPAVTVPAVFTLEVRGREGGRVLEYRTDGTANALRTPSGGRDGLGVGAVAFKASHYTRGKDGAPAAVVPPLSADADKGDQDTLVAAVSSGRGYWNESETGATLRSQESPNKADTLLAAPMAVRRLTPRECERLQGFPDDWTAITYRGKPAADGPRYKALGNSMAVNVMRFIGERIALHDEMTATMFAGEEETMTGIMESSPQLFTADRQDWHTPQVVVDALLRGWGSIALDPCANEGSIVPAALRVMLPTPERLAVPQPRGVRLDDGLAFDWDVIGPRLVYVNPPFGLKGKDGGATPWLRKAAETQVAEVVVLLPARTDTAAFHDLIFGRCDALCFWRSRLRFSGARDCAPFPSVFVYFGSSPEKFAAAFEPHGKVLIQP